MVVQTCSVGCNKINTVNNIPQLVKLCSIVDAVSSTLPCCAFQRTCMCLMNHAKTKGSMKAIGPLQSAHFLCPNCCCWTANLFRTLNYMNLQLLHIAVALLKKVCFHWCKHSLLLLEPMQIDTSAVFGIEDSVCLMCLLMVIKLGLFAQLTFDSQLRLHKAQLSMGSLQQPCASSRVAYLSLLIHRVYGSHQKPALLSALPLNKLG